jgi:hypothetical protein
MLETMKMKPPHFLRQAVSHMCFSFGNGELTWKNSILKVCSHVTNVYVQHGRPEHLRAVLDLRCVQYLTINLRIFEAAIGDAQYPFFLTITHLKLLPYDHYSVDLCDLDQIPRLTHLSLHTKLLRPTSHTQLHAHTRLQCIVFFSRAFEVEEEPIEVDETSPLLGDSRFLCMQQKMDSCLDWLRGAHSGQDHWALADAFIAAKRAGKVDGESSEFGV